MLVEELPNKQKVELFDFYFRTQAKKIDLLNSIHQTGHLPAERKEELLRSAIYIISTYPAADLSPILQEVFGKTK